MKKIILHIMLISFVVSSSQALISDQLKKIYRSYPTLCAGTVGFIGGYGLKKIFELAASASDWKNSMPLLFGTLGLGISSRKSKQYFLVANTPFILGMLFPNKWWDKLGNIPVLKTCSKWIKPFKCINKECKGICHKCKLQTMLAYIFATGMISNIKSAIASTFLLKFSIPTYCSDFRCRKPLFPFPSTLTHTCGHAFHTNCLENALKETEFQEICPKNRCGGEIVANPKKITWEEEIIKTQNVNQNSQCYVCLTEFQMNETVSSIQCNHPFHLQCLTNWFEQSKITTRKSTCPTCREEATFKTCINGQPI